MILSNAVDVKYKINTNGMNTVEVARMLKENRVNGFLKYINERSVIVAVSREDIKRNRIAMEGLRNENQN
ncbi:hypothetical protein [Staphylococcus gallinarum]|uniref:Uncharacterized protein n=2 Tax=Staphylococcus gallinarum TaxID=1293 RepID=A0A418HNM4_STAGA|nr:hypothetical protein [Staphylococcus gallinarum]PTL09921.1 hypothetical protein BUZ09_04570 [Staphylococcus gallinarum]RIL31307.1 hypothetical protein BUY98_11485 [Staphylococcus gallinarum]RIL42916.1 hypothetical protein BUZ01_08655 [Staphylococcus gallinarum]RIO77337.1 hypothetical protein BUZ12_04380 [Staphylococcus gallinarum]RIO83589.1 hypothetical protein BUZ11_04010 [Staphylococcus gallinarum]